MEKKRTL